MSACTASEMAIAMTNAPATRAGSAASSLGKMYGAATRVTMAIRSERLVLEGSHDRARAATPQADNASSKDGSQETRRAACAYATPNATEAKTAESEEAAALDANAEPRSTAKKKRIGPATTGKPASQPATDGPQRLPANERRSKKPGTRKSFSRSTVDAPNWTSEPGSVSTLTCHRFGACYRTLRCETNRVGKPGGSATSPAARVAAPTLVAFNDITTTPRFPAPRSSAIDAAVRQRRLDDVR